MKKVLLLLCKGFEVYEAAAFYDVLGWSGEHGFEAVNVVTVGLRNEVQGTFGIRIIPDQILSAINAEEFDALAIPGGFETYGYYEDAYSDSVSDLIRHFEKLRKPIASICVGALPIAKSGILRGRKATTYRLNKSLRPNQLAEFGVKVADQPIVHDGNVTTSACPATALKVAFGLLTELAGEKNAEQVRYLMGFGKEKY